jgi:dephospho-CoA kinase
MRFVVGLTGGIGSGKSTVAAAFVRLGGGLVDTDILARRLTASGGAALTPLVEAFGADILAPDGSLNRTAMRQRIFTDPAARRQLEGILHPLIRAEAKLEIAACSAPYALLAIPLLVETGGRAGYRLDRVLVVDCPESLQKARVMARSGLTADETQAMMAAQASRAMRLAAADDVIDNSGGLADMESAVASLHDRYMTMAAQAFRNTRSVWACGA